MGPPAGSAPRRGEPRTGLTRGGAHGISAARNVAIPHLRGAYAAWLDNDAIPQPGWLSALVRRMDDEVYGGIRRAPQTPATRGNPVSDQLSLLKTAFGRG